MKRKIEWNLARKMELTFYCDSKSSYVNVKIIGSISSTNRAIELNDEKFSI